MAFKQYKGDRMPSALPQKNLAEPEGEKVNMNENKLETINQVVQSHKNEYDKTFNELNENKDLSKNQKIQLNKEAWKTFQDKKNASIDSINRVTSVDIANINKKIDDISENKLNEIVDSGFTTEITKE